LATCCVADWQSASRDPPVAAPAGYQPATQQTASLRYEESATFAQAGKMFVELES